MNKEMLNLILKIRLSVSLLGEKEKNAWWESSFFSGNSESFLSPMYPRTSLLAKYYGAKDSATLVHDQHIGFGANVFHLFRLPEFIERDLHLILLDKKTEINSDNALKFLKENLSELGSLDISEGPIRLGSSADIKNIDSWKKIAYCYLQAFENNIRIYPFFSGS